MVPDCTWSAAETSATMEGVRNIEGMWGRKKVKKKKINGQADPKIAVEVQ